MCGIAGVVERPGERPPREALEAMGEALAHRGPDDQAVRCYGRAGFAFRRLSIIDVAGGAQPIDDESGRRHLVLNGEIYNYRDLRRELEARGHRFRTDGDAEAVVHGYEEFGDEVVRRLRGMFAFALWDEERQRLLLARAARVLRSMAGFPEDSYGRAVSCFGPEEKDALYSPEMKERVGGSSFALLHARYRESDAPDFLGRTLYVDTMTYLPGDLLVKIDIATMAHGLEARSPFLDHPLVEFAARLPSRYKLRGGTGKHILRRAVGDLLPSRILRRRKQGFGVPISRWLRSELNGMLRDVLFSPQAAARFFFRADEVRRLVAEHEAGRRDHGARLWALLMLELWCRRFLDGPPS